MFWDPLGEAFQKCNTSCTAVCCQGCCCSCSCRGTGTGWLLRARFHPALPCPKHCSWQSTVSALGLQAEGFTRFQCGWLFKKHQFLWKSKNSRVVQSVRLFLHWTAALGESARAGPGLLSPHQSCASPEQPEPICRGPALTARTATATASPTAGLFPAVLHMAMLWACSIPSTSAGEGSLPWGLIPPCWSEPLGAQGSIIAPCTGATVSALLLYFGGLFAALSRADSRLFRGRSIFPPQWPYPVQQVGSSSQGSSCCLIAAPCSHFGGLTLQSVEDVFLQG